MNELLMKLIYNKATAALIKAYYTFKTRNTKSFIFLATTGRSGTLSIVDILNKLNNCVALHEPYPAMHDHVLKAASYGDEKTVENIYKVRKAINIRRSAAGFDHYLEANHLFIKTFVNYAVEDFGDRLKVIHLVRNPVKVANSIYALQDQPGTEEGNRWWLDYHAPTNIIQIADSLENDPEFSHPFYKALWYWYEMEARIAHCKKALPKVPFVFIRTEELNDKDKLTALFEELEVDVPPEIIDNALNVKSHARTHQKKNSPLPDETCDEMHDKFKELLKANNIDPSAF